MHILLTRPLDDSKELILKFTSMKHKVSHLPLLQIKKISTHQIDFNQFKGVIFTSANSIKNLDGKQRYFIKKSLQKDKIESTSRMVGEELKLQSKGCLLYTSDAADDL